LRRLNTTYKSSITFQYLYYNNRPRLYLQMNYLYDYMLGTMLEINCPKCLASNILEDRQVERDMECTTCGAIFLVEVEKESPPNEENTLNEESESFVKDTEYLDEENEVFADSVDLSQIIITTGPPPFEYEVIDTLIVLETLSKNFFQEAGPSQLVTESLASFMT